MKHTLLFLSFFFIFTFLRIGESSVINPGFDLLSTPIGGAFIDIPDPIVPGGVRVDLRGAPIGPGDTDTIVERLAGLPDGQIGIIDVELVALSLVSVDPVDIGGTLFDVFVALNPQIPSLGQIDITSHGPNGGTFDSFFDVFVEVTFSEVGNPGNSPPPVFQQDQLLSIGSLWSHTPPPGYPEDQRFPSGGFYPGVDPDTGDVVGVQHIGPHPDTDPARTVPVPASVLLFAPALFGIFGFKRKRKDFVI